MDSHTEKDQFTICANELIKLREQITDKRKIDRESIGLMLHEAADMMLMMARRQAMPSS